MATLYIVRHGQASFGSDDYDRLSPLGRRQAEVVGEYFRDCGIHLDAAYSGDLSRQQDTARLALAAQPATVPHHIDARFNEIENDVQIQLLAPLVIERDPAIKALVDKGLASSKDYQKVIAAVFNYWVSAECNEPRLQSWPDYSAGVVQALREVMQAQGAGKTVAIFTSGGTLATLVAHVLGFGGDKTYQFYEPVFNCSVTQLFYSGTRVSMSYFNDCSFLRVMGQARGEELVSYR